MSVIRWSWVLIPSSLAFAAPRVADACSQPACSAAAFVPAEGVKVPANAPGLFWFPLTNRINDVPPDPKHVSLARAVDLHTPITFSAVQMTDRRAFLLVPDAPLTVGETYIAADAETCDGVPVATTRFVVGPPAPLPTSLGTLTSSDQKIAPISVETRSGACTADVSAAQRVLSLDFDPTTATWGDLLEVSLDVDGRPWGDAKVVHSTFTGNPTGATATLYQVCASTDTGVSVGEGLQDGDHVVQMHATVMGTQTTVASTTVTVSVDCKQANPPPVDPPVTPPVTDGTDGGCNATGSGSLAWLGLALGALVVVRRARR